MPDRADVLTPPEARSTARAAGLMVARPGRAAAHLAGQLGLVAVLTWGAATVPSWWMRVPLWIGLGLTIAGLGGFIHDAVHGLNFRRRALDDLAGVVVGSAMLFPFGCYRQFHLAHHAATVSEDDPEGLPITFRSRLQYAVLMPIGIPVFLATVWWGALRCVVGARPPEWCRHPARVRTSTLLSLVLIAGAVLVALRWPALVVTGYLPGLAIAYMVVLGVLLLPEHYRAVPGDPVVLQTTTTDSNPAMTWLFWGANFHAPHHLVPNVPGPDLPRLTALLSERLPRPWRSSGYLRWHASLLRELPWLASGAPATSSATARNATPPKPLSP